MKRLQHSTGTANRCIVTPEGRAPWPINQSTRSKGPQSDAVLVADALLRASNRLAIAKKALSQIVGLSESSLSRLRKKDFELDGKSLELAILFIKMYRSLHAIVSSDDTAAAAWLKNMNATLGAAPLE